ncbi:hypothetical protein BH24ACT3_BH24ACT3_02370 [soil metagenome]
MIQLVCLLTRNPALSPEEFQAHWRDVHGPLMRTPEIARHILRYEQHPRLPGRAGGPSDHDGVAIQWFRSLEDFQAFLAEPAYAELIRPDEQRLLDLDAIEVLLTAEPRVVIGAHQSWSV